MWSSGCAAYLEISGTKKHTETGKTQGAAYSPAFKLFSFADVALAS